MKTSTSSSPKGDDLFLGQETSEKDLLFSDELHIGLEEVEPVTLTAPLQRLPFPLHGHWAS